MRVGMNRVNGDMSAKINRKILCALFTLLISGVAVGQIQSQEVYFLQENGQIPIIRFFSEASKTICVTAYVLTSYDIAKALIDASHNNVDVKVLLNERQTIDNKYSLHRILMRGGVKVKVIGTKLGRVISDFGIIDGRAVYTGGTLLHTNIKATPKLDNYIIIRNNEEIVEKYQSEFFYLFNEAESLPLSIDHKRRTDDETI